jgi:hypothetical protein
MSLPDMRSRNIKTNSFQKRMTEYRNKVNLSTSHIYIYITNRLARQGNIPFSRTLNINAMSCMGGEALLAKYEHYLQYSLCNCNNTTAVRPLEINSEKMLQFEEGNQLEEKYALMTGQQNNKP